MTQTTDKAYLTGEAVFAEWRSSLIKGESRTVFPHSLPVPEITPGSITLIGGAPGVGKTALVMSVVVEALRHSAGMRALIANVEMPPDALLDRQLARLSGIDASHVRRRRCLPQHQERLDTGIATLATVVERLAFLRGPFNLPNVATAADAHRADVIVLDYIQRISPPGSDVDARTGMNRSMACLREFAANGCAVVVISAVGRTRDTQGRASYSAAGLSLASFRESSELEFGADDAFMLSPAKDRNPEMLRLAHLKSRNGALRSVDLIFDRPRQAFALLEEEAGAGAPSRRQAATRIQVIATCDDVAQAPQDVPDAAPSENEAEQ
jgi:replicative DNA helicase